MLIAGDIGGTKTELAMFSNEGGPHSPQGQIKFHSADYSSLQVIVKEFLTKVNKPVDRACFAVAGPVIGGRVKATNLPWMIEDKSLAQELNLNLKSVRLINDLEAFAYGLDSLESKDFITLHPGSEDAEGNTAVISAGTGLGEAGLLWDGFRQHPFACEGGHADFAPRNEVQIELLRYLLTRFKTVSYERVLAGP